MTVLSQLCLPKGWECHALGRLAVRVQEYGRPDLPPLSVFLDKGVVPRSFREEENHNRLGEDLARYQVVRPGDIVFNKLRTWQGGLGLSRYEGIVSPAYFVCRPGKETEPRYLHYLLRSSLYLQELARISKWMPPSQFDIGWDELRRLPIVAPPWSVQVAIADYLDSEIARIDAIVDKKRKMAELVLARRSAFIDEKIERLNKAYRSVRLKHVSPRIEVGIVVTPAAWYAETGVLALRGLNVRPGEITLEDPVSLSPEGHAFHQKSMLHAGDVVVVRTGQAGAAAEVPSELDGCNCIDLLIVRQSKLVLSNYLVLVLNSHWTQSHIDKHSVGTIQSHLNVSALADVTVPLPPLDAQRKIAKELESITARSAQLATVLEREVGLLFERRRAVMTMAVTGNLAIPGVAR